MHVPVRQLRRIRWAVRGTLVLCVGASVAANVLHAQPNAIAQTIAAWPPLALLLAIELISRVPVHHRTLAVARFVATTAIAGIAAWVSYWHMAAVAAVYGETGASPYLLPLSVDGLVVVASVSLVELTARIDVSTRGASDPAITMADTSMTTTPPVETDDVYSGLEPAAAATLGGSDGHDEANSASTRPESSDDKRETPDTMTAVASLLAADPEMRVPDIATRVGRTPRHVRRIMAELAAATDSGSSHANGTKVTDLADAAAHHK